MHFAWDSDGRGAPTTCQEVVPEPTPEEIEEVAEPVACCGSPWPGSNRVRGGGCANIFGASLAPSNLFVLLNFREVCVHLRLDVYSCLHILDRHLKY